MSNTSSSAADLGLLVSADGLAQMLDLSVRTLWRLRSAGKIPAPMKLGGSVRWRLADIHAWIAAGCPEHNGYSKKSRRASRG
ncbi:MAG: helix-turn-helix transcriptional regulator [Pirellulales bacterium]